MRLGLVLYGDLNTLSGGFLYDRMLVEHLRRRGDEVEIVSLPWRPYPLGLLDNLAARPLKRLIEAQVDLWLEDELAHPSLFLLNRRLKGRRPVPIVSMVHHLRCSEARSPWLNFMYREVERRYLQSADAFIFNSAATQEAVEGLAGKGKPEVVALPGGDRLGAGLNPREIAARVRSAGPFRLLFLGNLIPRKGLHTLIAAMAALPRRDWRLAVVGSLTMDRGYAGQVRRQADRAGLAGQVEFLGPLVNGELAACLAASHVLTVPSSYEGFGIVYVEGMRFGLPAIGSFAGGARELITHGRDGFLVEPGDVSGLTGCLDRLARDRELLLAMSLAARERALAHPSWEESMAVIRRFLADLLV